MMSKTTMPDPAETVTITVAGTSAGVRAIKDSLADQHPQLAMLKDIGLRKGHADLELDLPKVGDVTARVVLDVSPSG
jgi:hypothetical protein